MPKRIHATPLDCATTEELISALRRRALGCMIVCVRAEEDGDAWSYALKGSSILLGAMSAALSIKTSEQLGKRDGFEGNAAAKVN